MKSSTDVKFFKNSAQMALDSLLANKEGIGNLFVCGAFNEMTKDILFPWCQRFLGFFMLVFSG
jgi:hypothetical protein